MNIFNRKEIYITMDPQKFSQVTSQLACDNIRYVYKIHNTSGVTSGSVQSIGLNSSCMLQYYVYVHKRDYEKACFALKNIKLY